MDRDELLSAAKAALGEGRKDDYVIAPGRHADELAGKAPALAKILRKSELGTIARLYEAKDAEAGQAQSAFERTASLANWSVFLTAVFSALLLMYSPLETLLPGIPGKGLQIALALCGILSGAMGTMWLFKIRAGRLVERWMSARAAAETRRVKYFELATASPDDGAAGEMPLALLQCEYFRRYQLDVQLVYFRERGAQHERAADRLLNLSAFAVGLASIATGIGGLLGGAWIALVGLGVIATGLSSFASANETASQDSRNTERYRKTLDILEELSGRLDDVRLAAAGGERGPLEQFVAAVHEQLSLEHRQWLETAESTMASLAKLEESLAKLKAKQPEPK
jgi:hypothetical protein